MKRSEIFVNNAAVRRLIARTGLGVRQKSLARAARKSPRPQLNVQPFANNSSRNSVKTSPRKTSRNSAPKPSRHFLKNLLVPTRANNYRPHLVRRAGLVLMAICLLLLNLAYFYIQQQRILGDKTDVNATSLLAKTNAARAKSDLPPLSENNALTAAAQSKAQDMLAKDYWSHNSPSGETPWNFIAGAGYVYLNAGENLARGFTNSDAIIAAWLASPTHRANVLSAAYVDVGFAAVEGEMDGRDTILVVAEYGRPEAAGVAAPNSGGETGETMGATTEVGATQTRNFWTRLADGARNLTPSLIFTLAVLALVAAVTVIAHFAHWRLSPTLAKTWKLHHALIKICFVAVLAVGAVASYGGGMI